MKTPSARRAPAKRASAVPTVRQPRLSAAQDKYSRASAGTIALRMARIAMLNHRHDLFKAVDRQTYWRDARDPTPSNVPDLSGETQLRVIRAEN
ncbi:hypothetical protein ACCO45_013506 [Purpureocillium lilacinum]|uniref:Uncharacterized protein n=1 Tax=Purpureocillium lilacinum TaxID=33203 RepID=A0ACC4D7L1_PURLI